MRPVAAHLIQFTFKNAGQCMCYVVCLGGWVNQWNNSITLGNCTIWVLNISLVYLNPTFVCKHFQPAILFMFKNAGQCMCYVVCLGGRLNQWNNSITWGNCTIWVLNISLVYLNPTFVCKHFRPAISSFLWYSYRMHITATHSIPFILCVLLLPIWFSLRLKMQDSACAMLFV